MDHSKSKLLEKEKGEYVEVMGRQKQLRAFRRNIRKSNEEEAEFEDSEQITIIEEPIKLKIDEKRNRLLH